MKIITGFDEGLTTEPNPGEEDSPPTSPAEAYLPLFQAILHNSEVAENVFAREAKKQFRAQLSDIIKKCDGDPEDLWPKWVTSSSVVLPVSVDNTEVFDTYATILHNLVLNLAANVLSSIGDKSVIIPVSLNVKVRPVGSQEFMFTLKQRWSSQ